MGAKAASLYRLGPGSRPGLWCTFSSVFVMGSDSHYLLGTQAHHQVGRRVPPGPFSYAAACSATTVQWSRETWLYHCDLLDMASGTVPEGFEMEKKRWEQDQH